MRPIRYQVGYHINLSLLERIAWFSNVIASSKRQANRKFENWLWKSLGKLFITQIASSEGILYGRLKRIKIV